MKNKDAEKDGVSCIHAASRKEWREWLAANHDVHAGIWLIIYHKSSDMPTVYYEEAVKEGLCFGWIDSKPNKRDEVSYFQYFSARNPNSNWSKKNKEMVKELVEQGLMVAAGIRMVKLAQKSGTWTALDEVEKLIIPTDLMQAFQKYPYSLENWQSFPRSVKRGILEWIFNAKRKETRQKRVIKTANKAAQNIRANQYR